MGYIGRIGTVQLNHHAIKIHNNEDIVQVRQIARNMAKELGFGKVDETRITTVVSELARNILLYTLEGHITLDVVNQSTQTGIKIAAMDHGPGIKDIRKALQDNFSTSGGLGAGLPGVRRIMDEFTMDSAVGEGTQIFTLKWLEPEKVRNDIIKPGHRNRHPEVEGCI